GMVGRGERRAERTARRSGRRTSPGSRADVRAPSRSVSGGRFPVRRPAGVADARDAATHRPCDARTAGSAPAPAPRATVVVGGEADEGGGGSAYRFVKRPGGFARRLAPPLATSCRRSAATKNRGNR